MYLEKYPVTSLSGEKYKVSVYRSHIGLGVYEFEVKIYKDVSPTIFNLFKKNKLVYTFGTSWTKYHHWFGKYVNLAKHTIQDYEEKIKKEELDEEKHQIGIKEFIKWNGDILEK
ncbi:hypothetical protein [Chengkuizengella marina]|uniref:Uncharacterized protein n=1 Tax=Chengkuizengella marina TaxID=2507566 RepID=A0A6N9Q2B1_9BACL|nr:hypothetical protein [Chengkuizengella marina]NBI28664.1 hypothetical protein [Chengkuizengella marina]